MDLFGQQEKEIIRTLGFYQPYGTLMLLGKIETRWVRKGKRPPFPLGRYLFYTTKKRCDSFTIKEWSNKCFTAIQELTYNEPTNKLNGYAIAIGELKQVRPLDPNDAMSFVDFIGEKEEEKDGETIVKVQWALVFENVKRIEPFEFKMGKQGVGILERSERLKIKTI